MKNPMIPNTTLAKSLAMPRNNLSKNQIKKHKNSIKLIEKTFSSEAEIQKISIAITLITACSAASEFMKVPESSTPYQLKENDKKRESQQRDLNARKDAPEIAKKIDDVCEELNRHAMQYSWPVMDAILTSGNHLRRKSEKTKIADGIQLSVTHVHRLQELLSAFSIALKTGKVAHENGIDAQGARIGPLFYKGAKKPITPRVCLAIYLSFLIRRYLQTRTFRWSKCELVPGWKEIVQPTDNSKNIRKITKKVHWDLVRSFVDETFTKPDKGDLIVNAETTLSRNSSIKICGYNND